MSDTEQRAELSSRAINDLPDSAFAYIEPGGTRDAEGRTTPRSLRHFPIHDAAHVRNALARAAQSPFGEKAMPKIRAAARRFGIELSDDRSAPRGPVEYRSAAIADVDVTARLIEVVAAPYNEEAVVEYRGELWRETFLPGAFDGIDTRQTRVRTNREHDEARTFGKVVQWWPERPEGLVAEVRAAKTPLGDEVLALTSEDMLSASLAFGVRGSDQELDRPFRRIKKAFVRHLSFVEVPAYEGAQVLAVRHHDTGLVSAADLPKLVTPDLDELLAWQRTRRQG